MPAIARCTSSERASGNRRAISCRLCGSARRCLRQRLEGAHLRAGGGHAGDARGDGTHFADVGERPVAQVDLGDRDFVVARTRQRANRAFVRLGAAQAGQHRRMRHVGGPRGAGGQHLPRQAGLCSWWGRADQIDLGLAQAAARHAIGDHAHELGLLLRRREPAEAARQRHHAGLHRRFVGVARELEVAVARARGRVRSRRAPPPPRARAAAPGRSRRRNARDGRGTCAPRSRRAAAPRA